MIAVFYRHKLLILQQSDGRKLYGPNAALIEQVKVTSTAALLKMATLR